MLSRTLFARRDPLRLILAAARLFRRHRARPSHSIAGPFLLAALIAFTGSWLDDGGEPAAAPLTPASVGLATELRRTPFTVRDADPATPTAPRAAPPPPPRTVPSRVLPRASRAVRRAPARPAAAPRWRRPAAGPLTSPYGPRWGRLHKGIDLGAAYGSPVYAAFDGVVVSATVESDYGRRIVIAHAGGIRTTYNHMSAFLVHGGRVRAGQAIGRVGSSGRSTGPHLHFEVEIGGAVVDPRQFLRQRGVWI